MNYQQCANHLAKILLAGSFDAEPETVVSALMTEAEVLGGQMWSISSTGTGTELPVCYECRVVLVAGDTYSLGVGVLNPEVPDELEVMAKTNVLGFVGACHQRCRRPGNDEARASMWKLAKEQLEFELAGGFNEDLEA